LLALANPNKAAFQAGFFKTRKGQYAEGDRFLGIIVPAIRQLARQFRQLSLTCALPTSSQPTTRQYLPCTTTGYV
jgi:hypothetical protein